MAAVYRTDQVGSLIRPEQLLTARDKWLAGRMSRERLRDEEDAAILEALELQQQAGIAVFTDGEMRRDAWMTDFSDAVEGFSLDFGFAAYVLPETIEALERQGLDPEQELAEDSAAENACYGALPRDRVTLGMRICRGNWTSWGGGRGGYDWVAERVFGALHVDRFVLAYDTDRAGGIEPLRHVPAGKVVALGLVSTKTPRLEQQTDLLRRIDEAAKYCPLHCLALAPQCGFQSSAMRMAPS